MSFAPLPKQASNEMQSKNAPTTAHLLERQTNEVMLHFTVLGATLTQFPWIDEEHVSFIILYWDVLI